ncbi:EAL domain-containing response regulator [Pseudomonas synxantha]|uniref:EAL domain-containing response regulator n=1 Tax=Pseudomonas synxantha TaxID=47883 RepID=UPI002790B3DC|nr:EAL domain-containing response regulator [Pseudomonas synxantha]MDQ0977083.1 EAL domain-containing protein (putative c-di-GMP-specific phosphodiesterase class I)/ActR/RegA family two-component response regulator [Pseudomonas synxantha]
MRSLNVLILEDNPFQLMALHQMLNANGVFNVLTAENVETARQSLDSKGPVDIAICDLYLEQGDGLELIRELAERRLAQVLVLLSNAEPDVLEGVANMARQMGLKVLACLPKPASATLIGQVLADCKAHLRPGPLVLSWERVRQLLGLSDSEQLPPSADISQATIAACGRGWYQPIVSQAGVLQGVEALARWQLSEGELLLPDEFLPVLEFAGMEEAFTWHVLEQALGLANLVMGETGQVLPVAVNIPGRMLERAHFPQVLQGLLQLHGVPAHSLTLELVETSTLKTDSAHVTGLLRLRMLGCQLSIGDFGMGGTSLQHLLELPFTELKIPPAFACGMANDDRKAAVVAGAMSMAKRLNIAVVVTGVETAADYHAVSELGAAWLQGCFIARPMDAEALKQWIAFQARPARVPAHK